MDECWVQSKLERGRCQEDGDGDILIMLAVGSHRSGPGSNVESGERGVLSRVT